MNYVIFKTGGKQYKASSGDRLEVDKIDAKDNKVIFSDILLSVAGGEVKIGKPYLQNSKLHAKVVENKKGKKIRVSKFKSKVRYRKVIGFRPHISLVEIEKFEAGKNSPNK